ncbi:hypothetical protein V6N13_033466 [Hibiscus sabdariffa]
MKTHSKNPVFVSLVPFIFLLYSFAQFCYAATDTLRQGKTLRNGDTLISENSVFELGFFSPENSTFTYLGIWYKFNPKAVVWVANRDTPISHRNRVLRIEDDGKLVVREGNNSLVWSSNVTGSSNNAAAKLLDTGNFVLSRDDSIGDLNRALWQSFNEPTDTFLLEMRVLVNFKRGEYNAYRLLKSPDDPHPANECDHYNFCGNYSTCDQFDSRKCVCLEGFRPKSQDQWDARNWSGGCVRKIKLQCPSTDDGTSRGKGRFKKIRCTKLPDLANVFSPAGDLDACRRHCLENCSCTAYAFITGIQCMIWTGDLVDMQHFQHGGSLEFFYRLHHSELDHGRKISNLIIVIVSLVVAGCLAATLWLVWRYKTKLKVSSKLCCKDDDVAVFEVSNNKSKEFTTDLPGPPDILIDGNQVNGTDLQNFNFSCIATATKNFCEENRLGQGGFGAVYKLEPDKISWQMRPRKQG